MRHYETMIIADAGLTEEQLETVLEKYKKIVVDGGGEVGEAGLWDRGRRMLAYPVKHKSEGVYLLIQFVSDQEVPHELDRLLRIDDSVIRHLVVRQDDREE